ncbi:hypothetical protein JL722_2750 [Aureococcus anophagefferens]|nr:hypothetical protein JL722_2750 [Aureococcus anophagefferens]
MAVPRVGAAVCMRDAASEGVVARVDASTVRVECAWGSAEFPAPSPAPAVGGAVALPGPCAGVVVQIEGDAVVVRAAWGSWRAAWARVGARGFGPPGRASRGARTAADGRAPRLARADGAHLVAPGLDVVPSGDVLRALPCADGYAVVTPFGARAAAVGGGDAVLDWGGRLVAPHDARSLAALARRKSGEAADIYEATARDVGDEAAELKIYRTAAASDGPRDLRALVDGASSELASSLERAEADHPELRRARDEVTDLSGAVGAAVASRAARDLEARSARGARGREPHGRPRDAHGRRGRRGQPGRRAQGQGPGGRGARRREQAARRRRVRAFDGALAAAREFLVLVAESAGGAGEAAAAVAHAAADFARAWLREARSAGFAAPPARPRTRSARPSPRPWRPPRPAASAKAGSSTSPSPRTPTRRARAGRDRVRRVGRGARRGAPESGDDLARRAATLALGYAGGGDHNALGALLAESPLKSALEASRAAAASRLSRRARRRRGRRRRAARRGRVGVAPRDAERAEPRRARHAFRPDGDGRRRRRGAGAVATPADDVVATAESLAADASARDDVVRKVNDAALGFLLRHLPAMPVPPVDVESDNVDYFLDNLNLSQLRIDENDVTVDVASSDGSRVVRKGVGLRAGGDDADDGGGGGGGGALFALKAVRISATFPNLTWRFRQKQFPFLEAEGRADVAVADGAGKGRELPNFSSLGRVPLVSADFGTSDHLLERSRTRPSRFALSAAPNSESGDPEPVVALTRCDVAIDDLELTMDEHRFSWVFNSLGLFRTRSATTSAALRDLVVDKSRDLLEPINALLGASWAPLRRALDLPDVCDLPRLEGDCAGDVDVDGADARDLARDDTVVRVTSPARPRVLGLELAPGARAARARRRGGGRGGARRTSSSTPPPRAAETIGLKLKTHGTMTEACVVKDFARGPNGEVAAGERRGATVGFLLCACGARAPRAGKE